MKNTDYQKTFRLAEMLLAELERNGVTDAHHNTIRGQGNAVIPVITVDGCVPARQNFTVPEVFEGDDLEELFRRTSRMLVRDVLEELERSHAELDPLDRIRRVMASRETVREKAAALLEYYEDTPDRAGKEFDTLDMCLDLLRELTEQSMQNSGLL